MSFRSDAGRRKKIILWIVAAPVLGLLALPCLISYAYARGAEEAAVTRQVTYDPMRVRMERLVEATTKAGFPSTILAEGGER